MNYVIERNGVKTTPDTIFIETINYNELWNKVLVHEAKEAQHEKTIAKSKSGHFYVNAIITVNAKNLKKPPAYVRLSYLGTFIKEMEAKTDESGKIVIKHKLIRSRIYSIEMLNEHKKVIAKQNFIGGKKINLDL